jgi:hypothetical protein
MFGLSGMAQDDPAAQAQAAMQAMMKHMEVTPIHKAMAERVGKWEAHSKMWSMPGQPPEEATGTIENSAILGGRYLLSHYKSTIMGMPFEGYGVMGYDNTKKTYSSSWIDNMSTNMIYMTGSYDEATKSYTFTGTMTDPMSGGDVETKSVTRIESKDRFVMEMYMMMGDQEMKFLEIVHTRAE